MDYLSLFRAYHYWGYRYARFRSDAQVNPILQTTITVVRWMGIIVLAVAILPMLGIGGMQLYRTETPGPVKDSKLTPRIKETALALWSIYLGLTIACATSYFVAGMTVFDSICHSFSTIAIGGFLRTIVP